MKIYIDITNLLMSNAITGIQRVVSEIIKELKLDAEHEILLLSYRYKDRIYNVIDNDDEGKNLSVRDMEAGSIFLDIDNVWNMWIRRSSLLPLLKERGIKCVVYLYDIIPVSHPNYSHRNTVVNFIDYLAAYLEYADLIMTSAKHTKDLLTQLCIKWDIAMPQVDVVPLGADNIKDVKNNKFEKILLPARFLLMVGTIEPRKNHELLLDAYDIELKSLGLSIVFAGRFGWDVATLRRRIEKHPDFGKNILYFENPNDDMLNQLYEKAFFLVFPSFVEGFGLPVVEALQRCLPVLAADIPVLQEVGMHYCDYFSLNDATQLIYNVKKYLDNFSLYEERKKLIATYRITTWWDVKNRMIECLKNIEMDKTVNVPEIKQMVVLTAREKDILDTLPFIEHYMPFIREVVLCCPDELPDKINCCYKGRLSIIYLTDSEVLAGTKLPDDHTKRNFYLRCMAMRSDVLDENFIMSDDDYRPLQVIDLTVFYESCKYVAYYFYMLRDWKGSGGRFTSFDLSMFRTYEFLKEYKYPCYQFSSHMPQIINKGIYLEMINKHPGIIMEGLDEWSTYFNYLLKTYPNYVTVKPYVTLMWPGHISDWPITVKQNTFLFENYYEENYQKGRIFEGLSKRWKQNIGFENTEKIVRFMRNQNYGEEIKVKFDIYRKVYQLEHHSIPEIIIMIQKHKIILPQYLILAKGSSNRLPVTIIDLKNKAERRVVKVGFRYLTIDGVPLVDWQWTEFLCKTRMGEICIWGMNDIGNYILEVTFQESVKAENQRCSVVIVD